MWLPPNSPDLASVDFYLFCRLKSALNGWCFFDATDLIKNATEKPRRLSQNGYQEYFQHIFKRWQKSIMAQGDYFEVKYSLND
jgi:hypothetical protein